MIKYVSASTRLWCLAAFVGLIPLLGSMLSSEDALAKSAVRFATWPGSGPDKWASIWLVERFIAPGATVELIEENTYMLDTVMIDVPQSDYLRDGQRTTFEKLRLDWEQGKLGAGSRHLHTPANQHAIALMSQLLHDVEVNTWQPDQLAESRIVEQAYRDLQNEFQRDAIPRDCYQALFDQLADQLLVSGLASLNDPDALRPSSDCSRTRALRAAQPQVQEITPQTIAQYLRRGQKVVFVDVREPEEFDEIRIPGAKNIQIRNVNQSTINQLQDADLLVSYCVKDFRGYEMALKLAKAGLPNSTIMNPYGMRGWIKAGLPVYRSENNELAQDEKTQTEEKQIEAMHRCLLEGQFCQSISNATLSEAMVEEQEQVM